MHPRRLFKSAYSHAFTAYRLVRLRVSATSSVDRFRTPLHGSCDRLPISPGEQQHDERASTALAITCACLRRLTPSESCG